MILLDTNVVSEVMRQAAAPAVTAWLNEQHAETLYLSAVSLAELKAGIALLPGGKRKSALAEKMDEQMERLFETRILDFDASAAHCYADIISRAKKCGLAIHMADAMIAAIAAAHSATVATRDTQPFVAAKVPVINPWRLA